MKSNDKIYSEISLTKSKQEKQHTGDHNKNMEKSAIQRIKYINPYISNTNFWLKLLTSYIRVITFVYRIIILNVYRYYEARQYLEHVRPTINDW